MIKQKKAAGVDTGKKEKKETPDREVSSSSISTVPEYALEWIKSRRAAKGQNPNVGSIPKLWPTAEFRTFMLAHYALGNTMISLCKMDGMPKMQTVYGWLAKADNAVAGHMDHRDVHPDFLRLRETHRRARAARLDYDVEMLGEIERRLRDERQQAPALDKNGELKMLDSGKVILIPNPNAIEPHAARVIVESIRWRLSRLRPELYGDRQEVKLSGGLKLERPADEAPDWIREKVADLAATLPQTLSKTLH